MVRCDGMVRCGEVWMLWCGKIWCGKICSVRGKLDASVSKEWLIC